MGSMQQDLECRLIAYTLADKRFTAHAAARINPNQLKTQSAIRMLSMIFGYFNKFNGIITDRVIDDQIRKRGLSVDETLAMRDIRIEAKNEIVTDESELDYIIDQLLDTYKRRLILNIAEDIANIGPNRCSPDELQQLQNRITKQLVNVQIIGTDITREGEISEDAVDRLEAYEHRKAHPESQEIIKTGWTAFDEVNGGVRPGELAYVIGRQGGGKSIFMLQLGYAAWLQGKNVILFSLEISKDDYQRRFDACAARVDVGGLKMGTLSEEEENKYRRYITNLKLGKSPAGKDVGIFHIIDLTSPTPAMIAQLVEQSEKKRGIIYDVVIIDYSQLMRPNTVYEKKYQELGAIALDLKNFARERKKFVLSAAQMSRAGASETMRSTATTAASAESDAVGYHVDYMFSVFSTSDLEGKLEMPKVRDGTPMRISYIKNFRCMRMDENTTSWESI